MSGLSNSGLEMPILANVCNKGTMRSERFQAKENASTKVNCRSQSIIADLKNVFKAGARVELYKCFTILYRYWFTLVHYFIDMQLHKKNNILTSDKKSSGNLLSE